MQLKFFTRVIYLKEKMFTNKSIYLKNNPDNVHNYITDKIICNDKDPRCLIIKFKKLPTKET